MARATSRREFLGALGATTIGGSEVIASTANDKQMAHGRQARSKHVVDTSSAAASASDSLEVGRPTYEAGQHSYSAVRQSTETPTATESPAPTPESQSGGGWGIFYILGLASLGAVGVNVLAGVIGGTVLLLSEAMADPGLDLLLTNAKEAANEAEEARKADEYDRAIDAWDRALDEYENALDQAQSLGKDSTANDIQKAIDRVEDNREKTRLEKNHVQMVATIEDANEMVEQANRAFEDGNFEKAESTFEQAENKFESALKTAREHDFDETAMIEDRLTETEQSLQDCELAAIEERIADVEYILDHGNDYVRTETDFEELREELQSLPFDRPNRVDPLLERAEEGHIRAQLEQGQALIDEAKEQLEAEEFYEARESFGEAQDYLEEVLELATEYELENLQNELDDMIEVCIQNASEARRVLFDVGDVEQPDPVSIEDLESPDTGPPPSGIDSGRDDESEEHAPGADWDLDDELKAEMPPHQELEPLGSGGHALVYKVRLKETDDVVARKTPKLDGTLTLRDAERFLDAAETWSSTDDHENIVTVHDWGFDGKPWLLMEYVDGGDLSEFVGDLSIERTLEILASIADALTHARGVDHLDVKPANILLSEDGTPKLADWGLAKVAFGHAATDTSMGITPAYAAPEQVDRTLGDRDNLTDIYQLGVTGYELVTGQLPFDPDAPESLDQRILEGQPTPPSEVNPDVNRELEDLLLKAMATERTERFEAAIQLRNTLQEVLDDWREESP